MVELARKDRVDLAEDGEHHFNFGGEVSVVGGVGVGIGVTVGTLANAASTVAPILGVGSAGAGAAVEQASTRVPISLARTTVSFIPLPPGLSASDGILTV